MYTLPYPFHTGKVTENENITGSLMVDVKDVTSIVAIENVILTTKANFIYSAK